MDLDEEQLHSKLRTKGKCQTYLLRSDILELKPRTRRQGKCLGAALEVLEYERGLLEMSDTSKEYNYISNDIWFHLASYIPPEEVQKFSLICSQSAICLKSRHFWLQLYRQYCQHSQNKNKWILQLPAHLQMHQLADCDANTLRQRVIQALFYCHPPFVERLKTNYKLETLVGRTYLSSWHLMVQCVWMMCYKFRSNSAKTNTRNQKSSTLSQQHQQNEVMNIDDVVHDWESLADESNNNQHATGNHKRAFTNSSQLPSDNNDGVSLLIICCDRFIPFPSEFLCANSSIRLKDTRELLSTDMRSINLEIDLVSLTGDQKVTWKYHHIQKYKVLPWWHPDFRKLNKCE